MQGIRVLSHRAQRDRAGPNVASIRSNVSPNRRSEHREVPIDVPEVPEVIGRHVSIPAIGTASRTSASRSLADAALIVFVPHRIRCTPRLVLARVGLDDVDDLLLLSGDPKVSY